MNIRPIRTEEDYQAALERISALFAASPGTSEGDELDILTTLVEVFEDANYPVLPPDPIEAILHVIEAKGLSRRDLEPYIGSRARVSEILNRKRPLTLTMIQRLSSGLGIPPEVLIGIPATPPRVRSTAFIAPIGSTLYHVVHRFLIEAQSDNLTKSGHALSKKISASQVGRLLPFEYTMGFVWPAIPSNEIQRNLGPKIITPTESPSPSFSLVRPSSPQVVEVTSHSSA